MTSFDQFLFLIFIEIIFPCGAVVKKKKKNLPAMQETWVRSLAEEDPLEKEWLPTLVFLPGKSHGQTVHGVTKSWTQLSDFG